MIEVTTDELEAVCRLAERVGFELGLDVDGLEVAHLRAVLGLDAAVQDALLRLASGERWSVSRLEAEVRWVVRPRHPNAKPRPLRAQLERLYRVEGFSVKALARRLGIANKTLREWLTEAGIERRSQHEQEALERRAGGRETG